jgi:hypothetical protein
MRSGGGVRRKEVCGEGGIGMTEKALKSEDRSREISIDPERLLESLGIDEYKINWNEKAVYLSRQVLEIVAFKFDKRLINGAKGIWVAGWWWKEA